MADHVLAHRSGHDIDAGHRLRRERPIVSVAQREHEQVFPRAGWVEHDPVEIWTNTAVGDRRGAGTTRVCRREISPPSA